MRKKAIIVGCALLLTARAAPGAMWYVDGSVSQPGDGKSWQTAFKKIQEAMEAASPGDTVTVATGLYVENIHFDGKNIVLRSVNPLDPDVVANTVVDGGNTGSVVTFEGTESGWCTLSGFSIRRGKAWMGGGIRGGTIQARTLAAIQNNYIYDNAAEFAGGALAYCDGAIRSNVIAQNSAATQLGVNGGGLYDCDGLIEGNVISRNWAMPLDSWPWYSSSGGGLDRCDGAIRRNLISENYAHYGGGLSDCAGAIEYNVIRGNWATLDGGGLIGCDGPIRNNVIAGNRANPEHVWYSMGRGGGLAACNGDITGNTIVANRGTGSGGGIYCWDGARIVNCIIWANEAPNNPQLDCPGPEAPRYSCIQDWAGGGEGNISEDPKFVDAEKGDFRLRADSPCIDAGFNGPDLPETDIAGMPRIMFGGKSFTVDIGAYEFFYTGLQKGPGPDEATLVWSFVPGKTYSIFYTDDLFNWHTAITNFPSSGNTTTSWLDDGSLTGLPPLLAPRRFYRLLENP